MKKSLLLLLCAAAITFAPVITGCNSPKEKVEESLENVEDANENLDEANEELAEAEQNYQKDLQDFKLKTSELYEANNKSMEAFNLLIVNEKKMLKDKYSVQLKELKSKNDELKKRLDEYQDDGSEQWDVFKTNFNMEMERLSNDVANLKIENNK